MRRHFTRTFAVALAFAWTTACGDGGGGGQCTTSRDCPAGQTCVDGRCRPAGDGSDVDGDGDGDADDVPQDGDGDAVGDGSDAAPPLRSGFALTGGGISGNTGTWRYQFSLGAPQPMGSGRSGEYQGTFGPAAAHRR